MFRIGYRTIKTAIGASISIAISEWLELDFYSAAAILTILCISITRKDSLSVSWQRFIACVIGLAIATVIFELIGYHPISLSILLLLFIPLAVQINIKEGIVTSIVIILHLYTLKAVSFAIIVNELLLIVIGIGIALIMNLYMPSLDKEIAKVQKKIEDNFKKILYELAEFLRDPERIWDGKEITETFELLRQAKGLALISLDNQIRRNEDVRYQYFRMREKQFDIIERIIPYVSTLDDTVIQGHQLADFLQSLSEAVGPKNTSQLFLEQLDEMEQHFKQMALPKTRQEFEIRASLFYVMRELKQYLLTKETYYKLMKA